MPTTREAAPLSPDENATLLLDLAGTFGDQRPQCPSCIQQACE
jgi:hypothetical protein